MQAANGSALQEAGPWFIGLDGLSVFARLHVFSPSFLLQDPVSGCQDNWPGGSQGIEETKRWQN
ncbi:MAG: hypothetical protein VX715_02560 [Planctomycetota bacterium]|nr:hypothetical protein [Planctomycetota bacterium]